MSGGYLLTNMEINHYTVTMVIQNDLNLPVLESMPNLLMLISFSAAVMV